MYIEEDNKSMLATVISDILVYHGGVVEFQKESLEFLVPPSLSQILGIPEQGELAFAYRDDKSDTIDASYDSEFFNSLERLFAEKGRMATASYPPYEPRLKNLEKLLPQKFSLTNATFRLGQTTALQDLHYLLVYLKYTGVSDEKSEGIAAVLVDEQTLAISDVSAKSDRILEESSDAGIAFPESEKTAKAMHGAHGFTLGLARTKLKEFIQSLERRLNRDVRRVYDYYETLKTEAQKSMAKKAASDGRQGRDIAAKLDAIAVEQRWKVQDLVAKYAMKIYIEPLAAVHIATASSIIWLNIKRRQETRRFPLAYNPILRELGSLPCEACFYPQGNYCICDDQLHIVCTNCFALCPQCRKNFCKACHPRGCPKCRETGA